MLEKLIYRRKWIKIRTSRSSENRAKDWAFAAGTENGGDPCHDRVRRHGCGRKGTQINRLIQALDPRGFEVFANSKATGGRTASPVPVEILDQDTGRRPDRHLRPELVPSGDD